MATEIGNAVARFLFDISDFVEKSQIAESTLLRLQALTEKPLRARIATTLSQRGPASSQVANSTSVENTQAAIIARTQAVEASAVQAQENNQRIRARIYELDTAGQQAALSAQETVQTRRARIYENGARVDATTIQQAETNRVRRARVYDLEASTIATSNAAVEQALQRRAKIYDTADKQEQAQTNQRAARVRRSTVDDRRQQRTADFVASYATAKAPQGDSQGTVNPGAVASVVNALKQESNALTTLEDQTIRTAIAQGRLKDAIDQIGKVLEKTTLTEAQRSDLLVQQAQLTERQAQADVDLALKQARNAAAMNDVTTAVTKLDEAHQLAAGSQEREAQVAGATISVYKQLQAALDGVAKSEVQVLTIQRELEKARDVVRGQLQNIPATPDNAQRRSGLQVDEAQLTALIIQAEQKHVQSVASLQRALKDYTQAIDTLRKQQSLYERETTAYNLLERQIIEIQKQKQRETNAYADAQVRAAVSTRQWGDALRILREQIQSAVSRGDVTRYEQLQATLANTARQRFDSSFLGTLTAGFRNLILPAGAAAAAIGAFYAAEHTVSEGLDLYAKLDLNKRSIEAFFNSVNRGDQTFNEAIEFAQRYRISYEEMGTAIQDAALIQRTSNATTEETLSVLARLQQRAPNKSFADAVRSVVELQSGQIQSIERVFQVPQRFAQQLNHEIEAGRDPIEALDELLNRLGNTSETLDARTQGLAGAQGRLANAWMADKTQLGGFLSGPATGFLNWLAQALEGAHQLGDGLASVLKIQNSDLPKLFEAFGKAEQQSHSEFGTNLARNASPAYAVMDQLINGYIAAGAAGKSAEQNLKTSNEAIRASVQKLQDQSVTYAPQLAAYYGSAYAQIKKTGEATGTAAQNQAQSIDTIVAKINVLNNRYDDTTISANELAVGLRELTQGMQLEPKLGIVEAIKREFPTAERQLKELEAAREGLQQAIGRAETIQEKVQFIADYQQVVNAINDLQGQSPMTIDVDFRVNQEQALNKLFGDVTGAGEDLLKGRQQLVEQYRQRVTGLYQQLAANQSAFNKQSERSERDHNLQMQQQSDDFYAQQAQASADYFRQRAKSIEDFNRQEARGDRDFAQGQARAYRDNAIQLRREQEDFERQQQRQSRDRQLEDFRSERDHLKQMQQLRQSYDTDSQRSLEDFNRDRVKLLAEGRVKEAQLAAEQFAIQKRRRDEDYARSRSGNTDDYLEGRRDVRLDRGRADADAAQDRATQQARQREDFARQIADAKAARAQQRIDAREDFNRQLVDQDANFAEQQRRQEAAFIQQRDRANAAYSQQEADRRADFATQQDTIRQQIKDEQTAFDDHWKALDKAYADHVKTAVDAYKATKDQQLKILELTNAGIQEKEAQALVAMQTTLDGMKNLSLDQATIADESGYKALLAWARGAARALDDFAKGGVDPALDPKLDRIRDKVEGNSPPKAGPLRNIDRGGYLVARAWAQAFQKGLDPGIDPLLDGIKRALSDRVRPGPDVRQGAVNSNTDARRDIGIPRTPFTQYYGSQADRVYRANPRDVEVWNKLDAQRSIVAQGAQQEVRIQVPIALHMDGERVAGAVSPYIAQEVANGMRIGIEIVDASQAVHLTQPGFRGGPSSVR